MSLRIFKSDEYDHTHERQQFRDLCSILKDMYDKTAEMNLLFANINFNGVPLDALLIKPDAIIVLEFKNYSGNVFAAENGDWKLDDGTIIKGGMGKNPFIQTKTNKFAVITTLSTWFPHAHVNLGHTTGVVVFNQRVTVDDRLISPKAKSWFHICDMDHIADKIYDITSPEIHYTNADLDKLPKILNCDDPKYIVYESSGALQTSTIPQNTPQVPTTTPKGKLNDKIRNVLSNSGYMIVHEMDKPGKAASFHVGVTDFGKSVEEYANTNYHGKLYEHQYTAMKLISEGKNVCIATSTNSGKTAIFHMAALEILEKDPNAKIIAVYPMKALGTQQKESWQNKLKNVKCGRIDGTIKDFSERLRIIKESNIITFTPDTVHAFLLGKLKDSKYTNALKQLLSNLKLVIIDEIHIYRGLLGSNSAYLFRRLNSCVQLAGGKLPQYITASATINDPVQHSSDISGVNNFEIIGPNMDTSPSCPTKIFFIKQGKGLANLLTELTENLPNDCKTITFIDSRKDVSQVVAETEKALKLQDIGIYPFKSGLEKEDYDNILAALKKDFRGVVSTSSLEVGIDIGTLNIAILNGIPNSSTSFYQRIGRVGRGNTNDEAVVIIMDNPNSIVTKRLFDNPQKIQSLPPEEPALYIDNENLVNIQALHFVGEGQEFQAVAGDNQKSAYNKIEQFFPQHFNDICRDVMNNQYPSLYQQISELGGTYPEIAYPLRQFGIRYRAYERNNEDQGRGDLSMQNILREAYTKAVYFYLSQPYRVKRVDRVKHEVILESISAKQSISTKPRTSIIVTPQKASKIHGHISFGDLHIMNLGLNEFTQIKGYKEFVKDDKGHVASERIIDYSKTEMFTYKMFTEGVIITHPLITSKIERGLMAKLLYEAFLSNSVFERSEIESCSGVLNADIGGIKSGTPFITIYDKIIGGLNITSRLMSPEELRNGYKMMVELIDNGIEQDIIGVPLKQETKNAIHVIYNDLVNNDPKDQGEAKVSEFVVARGSKAWYLIDQDTNQKVEVIIDDVIFQNKEREYKYFVTYVEDPSISVDNVNEGKIIAINGVSYKGKLLSIDTPRIINTKVLW